jgi:hypothetical protein
MLNIIKVWEDNGLLTKNSLSSLSPYSSLQKRLLDLIRKNVKIVGDLTEVNGYHGAFKYLYILHAAFSLATARGKPVSILSNIIVHSNNFLSKET